MATIKAYTDLEQSKTLTKILPLESADMYYEEVCNLPKPIVGNYILHIQCMKDKDYKKLSNLVLSPAWSLAALLNFLKSKNKFPDIKELSDGRFKLTTFIWDGKKSFQVFIADNLVNACYKLVLKLHECEML